MRPRILTCYLGLSVIIDKDVTRLHISYFFASRVHHFPSLQQAQSQVPQLFVFKWFAWLSSSVGYFITKQKRVIIEFYLHIFLSTLQMPLAPHSSVRLNSKLSGSNKQSLARSVLNPFSHDTNSFSLTTGTEIWILSPCLSLRRRACLNRGWSMTQPAG